MRSVICGLLIASWAASGLGAWAQDKKPAKDPAKKTEKNPVTNTATAAFNKLRGELKETIDRLKKIQEDYKQVRPQRRPALEDEFDAKRAAAKKLMDEARAAAEQAIVADATNPQLIDFLGALALEAHGRAHEAEALRLAALVLDHEAKAGRTAPRRPVLYRVAGEAAISLSQLDAAEKHLTELAKYPEEDVGRRSERLLKRLPDERKYWERESKLRKQEDKPANDPQALPRVRLETTQGPIVVELFENEAPNTVANFLHLARRKFYDDKPFSSPRAGEARVGRPPEPGEDEADDSGTDEENKKKQDKKESAEEKAKAEKEAAYQIACECANKNFRRHFHGSLSMVLAGGRKDTGYAEFRIVYGGRPESRPYDPVLDKDGQPEGGSTVFGRVIEGIEVLSRETQEPNRITKATVLRDRGHAYKVVKVGDEKPKPADKKPAEKGKKEPDKKPKAAKPQPKKR